MKRRGFLHLMLSAPLIANALIAEEKTEPEVLPDLEGYIPMKGKPINYGNHYTFETMQKMLEDIEEAANNPDSKSVVLEINSPGGPAVSTFEIATLSKTV